MFLELVDGGEVDLTQTFDLLRQIHQRLLPHRHVGFGRHFLIDSLELELGRLELLRQRFATDLELLRRHADVLEA